MASVALVYFAAARFSLSFLFQPEGLTAIWLPVGVFLSALLLTRPSFRAWLAGALFLTDLVAERVAGIPWFFSAVYALANSGYAVSTAWLLLRFVGEPIAFGRTRDVVGFLLLAVILNNGLWSLGVAVAVKLSPAATTTLAEFFKWWVSSNGVGVLLLTPFLVSWAARVKTGPGGWSFKRLLEGAALFIPLAVLNYMAFGSVAEHNVFSLLHAYVSFPFLLWAALRFGTRGVSSALLVLAIIALHFAAAGRDAALSPDASHWNTVILVQLYLAILAMPSLLLAGVVTERQRNYAMLQAEILERQRSELVRARLTAVLESTSDLVSTATPNGKLTYLNQAGRRLVGWSAEDSLDGRVIADVHPAWSWKKITAEGLPAAAAAGHWEGETALLDREGQEVPVSQVILAHRSPEGVLEYFSTIMRDMTEHKRAEEAERQARRLLRAVLDTVPVRVFWKDRQGVFLGCNLPFARDAGFASPDEAIGKNDFEMPWREQAERYRADDQEVTETGIPKVGYEEPQTTPKGDRIWIRTSKIPLRDAAGHILGILGTYEDITKSKQAEELLQSQAKHLEKLVQERTAELRENINELEAFSYTIAHDMRAPLRAILGYTQLLQWRCKDCLGEDGAQHLSHVTDAAQRMDRLIQDVLVMSRVTRTQLTLQPVDVEKVLHGIIHSYPAFQPPRVEIHVEHPLPLVLANEAALTQCVSNLLGNAVKFVAPGVRPSIRVWAEPVRSSEPKVPGRHAEASARAHAAPAAIGNPSSPTNNCFVRLWFADNGIGIAPDQHERIFEIFQRVDKSYEGTGIGLAIVRKAMQRMGGKVGLESAPGQGSRFWLEFRQPDGAQGT